MAATPMFPLGAVVFPFTAIPLRVFEPRYQTLLDRVLAGDRTFGTVLIARGHEVGGDDTRYDEGTRVRVVGVRSTEVGYRSIVVAGIERLRVTRWLPDNPHPWADVEPWPDEPEEVGGLVTQAHDHLEKVMALASELGADTAAIDLDVSKDPVTASYQLAALVPVVSLDAHALLTAPGPASRLRRVTELCDERIELLRAQLGAD